MTPACPARGADRGAVRPSRWSLQHCPRTPAHPTPQHGSPAHYVYMLLISMSSMWGGAIFENGHIAADQVYFFKVHYQHVGKFGRRRWQITRTMHTFL